MEINTKVNERENVDMSATAHMEFCILGSSRYEMDAILFLFSAVVLSTIWSLLGGLTDKPVSAYNE